MTAFGWSSEDLEMQVFDMSNGGKETLFSMGDDAALAVLSSQPHTLYDYFKQRFAQVTRTRRSRKFSKDPTATYKMESG